MAIRLFGFTFYDGKSWLRNSSGEIVETGESSKSAVFLVMIRVQADVSAMVATTASLKSVMVKELAFDCGLTNPVPAPRFAGMPDMKHVLFVCTGNTCRSPMAEGLFRKAVEGREDFEVSSAGIAASRDTPCNPETATLLNKRGVTLEDFGSRQVSEAILAKATHVFAMTMGHLNALEARFPDHADKFYLVCEFAETAGNRTGTVTDVPDPIGMGRRAYEEVAETFDVAIPTIIAYIDQTWKPEAPSAG